MNTGQRPRPGGGGVHALQRTSFAIDAALADVVGVEPSPTRPYAAVQQPLPGLGPLSVLRTAIQEFAGDQHAAKLPVERVIAQINDAIRHALPSATPDWSAHLLFEEVVRWVTEAYARADRDSRVP